MLKINSPKAPEKFVFKKGNYFFVSNDIEARGEAAVVAASASTQDKLLFTHDMASTASYRAHEDEETMDQEFSEPSKKQLKSSEGVTHKKDDFQGVKSSEICQAVKNSENSQGVKGSENIQEVKSSDTFQDIRSSTEAHTGGKMRESVDMQPQARSSEGVTPEQDDFQDVRSFDNFQKVKSADKCQGDKGSENFQVVKSSEEAEFRGVKGSAEEQGMANPRIESTLEWILSLPETFRKAGLRIRIRMYPDGSALI
jgi:hypothetical protein